MLNLPAKFPNYLKTSFFRLVMVCKNTSEVVTFTQVESENKFQVERLGICWEYKTWLLKPSKHVTMVRELFWSIPIWISFWGLEHKEEEWLLSTPLRTHISVFKRQISEIRKITSSPLGGVSWLGHLTHARSWKRGIPLDHSFSGARGKVIIPAQILWIK